MVLWSAQKCIPKMGQLKTEKFFGASLLSVQRLKVIRLEFTQRFTKKWTGSNQKFLAKKSSNVIKTKFSVQLNCENFLVINLRANPCRIPGSKSFNKIDTSFERAKMGPKFMIGLIHWKVALFATLR